MGQTRSALSRSAAAAVTPESADEAEQRFRIGRFRLEGSRQGDRSNENPMKDGLFSCLGRRKRHPSPTDVDVVCGTRAGADPAARGDLRVGKLPRDVLVSAAEQHGAAPGCFPTLPGPDGRTQRAVNPQAEFGPSHAPGLDRPTGETTAASCRCEKTNAEPVDNASDPPTGAMEDQPLGGSSQEFGKLTTGLISNDHTLTEMTKTGRTVAPCLAKATGDPPNSVTECPKDSDEPPLSPSGGQSFQGTIPKLIVTRDPSPSRPQETPALLSVRSVLCAGSSLEPHPDDESPCSDSGCGGSPALMRSPRKLSNSSSIGLSSASSFEESEDDFTGSDIESSLSPARSMCSPDDGSGVSVSSFIRQMIPYCMEFISFRTLQFRSKSLAPVMKSSETLLLPVTWELSVSSLCVQRQKQHLQEVK